MKFYQLIYKVSLIACVEMVRWMKVLAIGMFTFVNNDVSLELLPNVNYVVIFNAILLWGKRIRKNSRS